MSHMRIGYVHYRDEDETKRIAMLLVERRLVACANRKSRVRTAKVASR